MALDPAIGDQLSTLTLTAAQHSMTRLHGIFDNLSQGLGVINNTLIQQHGGVADDAAQFAGMNTAAGIPQSGYVKGA